MKVCFTKITAYDYFNPGEGFGAGGAERQLYLLSQQLKSEMSVSFAIGDHGQPPTEMRDGVRLYAAYRPDPSAGALHGIRQVAGLYRAMRRADADVYVFRGAPLKAGINYAIARLLGASWVYNLANDADIDRYPDRLSLPLRRLFERALADADGIITQTPYQQQRLADRYGVESVVVPNGYPPAGDPLPYSERSGLLWVGRFDEDQKRPHLFLDLAEALPDRRFVLVGEADDEHYSERIRERATALDNVEFVGQVPPDEVHDYFRSALALVNTSAYEGFPNTFLEAWRQGTPVVSLEVDPSRYADLPESGHSDGSFEGFVDLVAAVTDDRPRWERLAESAREYFEANLTIERAAAAYAAAIRDAHSSN